MKRLRLLAPAKINWTLEVLARRPDGYHEIRSVMQTLDLCDIVTLTDASAVTLELSGDASLLQEEDPGLNLAVRAAAALRSSTGGAAGVRIELEKHVPVAAGLGGGSSDAAAVLRGCNMLWSLGMSDEQLMDAGAGIGSDVPFFVVGGTARVSGRGERVRALDDARAVRLLLHTPSPEHRGDKTASMYAALSTDAFTEGEATHAVEEILANGRPVTDDVMVNVFERALANSQPDTRRAMDALLARGLTPHLSGSGPTIFLLDASSVVDASWQSVTTLPRADALRIEVL